MGSPEGCFSPQFLREHEVLSAPGDSQRDSRPGGTKDLQDVRRRENWKL